MTKKEFSVLASAIKTFYPRDNVIPNEKALELWYGMLCDLPYQITEAAISKHVISSKYPPTVAEIREIAAEITGGDIADWSKAWNDAVYAITKYGWYNTTQALASLDELTRETVKRLGFEQLCHSENPEADQRRFKEIYETLAKRKRADLQIPPTLKQIITALQIGGRNEPKNSIEKKQG